MIRRAPMGDIHSTSASGSRGTVPGAFIQCVNGRETQIYKLWCWDVDGICRKVHPTASVDIPAGTLGEFVTNSLSRNGWHNQAIGELLNNGRVQFIGLFEIWGSGLLYRSNLLGHVEATGWDSSSNDSNQRW